MTGKKPMRLGRCTFGEGEGGEERDRRERKMIKAEVKAGWLSTLWRKSSTFDRESSTSLSGKQRAEIRG